jgi:hypothetical protein
MPTKSVPAQGTSNWGTPLNQHLAQLNNPTTGGINTEALTSPTSNDEGHTYIDTNGILKRVNSSGAYQSLISSGLPVANTLVELQNLLATKNEVYYDGSVWKKITGNLSTVNTQDTEDGFVVSITGVSASTACGVRQEKYVSYDMFGADNSGVAIADDQMFAAHEVSNYFKLPIIQNGGTFLWSKKTMQVKEVPFVDLSGTTIKLDSNSGSVVNNGGPSPDHLIYNIPVNYKYSLTPAEISDLVTNYSGELVKGGGKLSMPLFHNYRDAMVKFESTSAEIYRTQNRPVELKDSVYLGLNGILSTPFAKNMDANIDAVTIIPKSPFRLKFYSPKFFIQDEQVPNFRLFNINRPQTDLIGMMVEETKPPVNSVVRYFITIFSTFDVTVKDATLSCQKYYFSGSYGMMLSETLRIMVDNMSGQDGWGLINTNWSKEITFENCFFNRVDSHWGGYDFTIRNCRIKNTGVKFAGGGTMLIENCRFLMNTVSNDEEERNVFFAPRQDYGYYFDGNLIIRDLTVEVSPSSTLNSAVVVSLGEVYYDPGIPNIYMPKQMIVENVTFVIPDNKANDQQAPFKCIIFDMDDVSTGTDATCRWSKVLYTICNQSK